MNPTFRLRRAQPEDQRAFYDVCLRTSDNGADGLHLHQQDPEALGNLYVGPYLALEPTFAFALEDDAGVCGYCLAVSDSETFYRRFVSEWLPLIQVKLREPPGEPAGWTLTEQLHHQLLHPETFIYFPPEFAPWPAHLHIDLLPRAQGRGWGRRMMEEQLERLRATGVRGAHLAVADGNRRAQAFYRKLGFQDLPAGPGAPADTVFLGRYI